MRRVVYGGTPHPYAKHWYVESRPTSFIVSIEGANITIITYTNSHLWCDYETYDNQDLTEVTFLEYYFSVRSLGYSNYQAELESVFFNHVEYIRNSNTILTVPGYEFDVATGHSYYHLNDTVAWDDGIENDTHGIRTPKHIEFQVVLYDQNALVPVQSVSATGNF